MKLAEVIQMVSGASGTPGSKLIITTLVCTMSPIHRGEVRPAGGHWTECGPSIRRPGRDSRVPTTPALHPEDNKNKDRTISA